LPSILARAEFKKERLLATSILLLIVIGYIIMHPHAWAEEMADRSGRKSS